MGNPEHLKWLQAGIATWNNFVKQQSIQADLRGFDLSGLSLRGINLNAAYLNDANLREADLSNSNLIGAFLGDADLSRADLSSANLSVARLERTNLSGAKLFGTYLIGCNINACNLNETNLGGAILGTTRFSDVDLSKAVDLASCIHMGPSSIGIDTFLKSEGKIPEVFLRGAGVPAVFIEYTKSMVEKPIDYYSVFISYSSRNEDLAKRLYADLHASGVRCWLFPEDAKWGEPIWGQIDVGIKTYDKLLVICSKDSLKSIPVLREIERALQREDKEKKNVLFPVRIDGYILKTWKHPRKADVLAKAVGDMCNWKDFGSYKRAFELLLRGLRAKKHGGQPKPKRKR